MSQPYPSVTAEHFHRSPQKHCKRAESFFQELTTSMQVAEARKISDQRQGVSVELWKLKTIDKP
jgi:hypothetical protein